jgi:Tryptophan/tyrosine permease family
MKFSFLFFALCADQSTLLHGLVTKSTSSLLLSSNSASAAAVSGRGNAKIAQAGNTEQIISKIDNADSQLFNAISLVAGTTVGAGILALPSVAIESGFIPSSAALIGAWIFMVTTGQLSLSLSVIIVSYHSAHSIQYNQLSY